MCAISGVLRLYVDLAPAKARDAVAGLGLLKRRDGGRATFLPMNAIRPADFRDKAVEREPGFVGMGDAVISFDPEYAAIFSSLLGRVAGLNGTTAKNIVKYREENGAFTTRRQVLKVPKLGPKAFEQCAGFLRVPESRNPLDNSAVHPESYDAAKRLLSLTGHSLSDVGGAKMADLPGAIANLGEEQAAAELGIGVPTLRDVAAELQKPGRDLRDELPKPILRTDVLELKDLKPGMILSGTVRNVIDFGVFVDIGVHQDGLVHISQVSDRRLRHPSEAVRVGDVVRVKVLEVDEKRKRISLSLRQAKE